MITWGGFRADLGNLSDGIMLYPLSYLLTLPILYRISASEDSSAASNSVILLALLSFNVFMQIANERSYGISERICLELGGYRRRIITRMATFGFWNVLLVAGCEIVVLHDVKLSFGQTLAIISTALVAIVATSTIGVVVADKLRHPILMLIAAGAILLIGISQSNINAALGMIESKTFSEWLIHFTVYLGIWTLIMLVTLLLSSKSFSLLKNVEENKARDVKVPTWISKGADWWKIAFRVAIIDPLPLASLFLMSVLFSAGTISGFSAESLPFQQPATSLGLLSSVLFMNIIPAILLSNIWQKRDIADQESLLYKSQAHVLLARVLQYSSFIVVIQIASILSIGAILGINPLDPLSLRASFWALVSAPALAAIGLLVLRKLKLPLLIGIASVVPMLLEGVSAVLAAVVSPIYPALANFLPTSLYAGLLGSPGLFNLHGTATNLYVSICFILALYLPLVFSVWLPLRNAKYKNVLQRP